MFYNLIFHELMCSDVLI